MDILIDDFWKNQEKDGQPFSIPSYFVRSTAPTNIEDDEIQAGKDTDLPTIFDVVEHLYQKSLKNSENPGLVIQIHGYNTGSQRNLDTDGIFQEWRRRVCPYINQVDPAIKNSSRFVYLGYRWPSESVPSNFGDAFKALPFLLTFLFWIGVLITGLSTLGWLQLKSIFLSIPIIIGVFLASLVVSLFILRIIVYFRDAYRASNFGIPDLVEFIRQLDENLLKRRINEARFQSVRQQLNDFSNVNPALLDLAVRKLWEELQQRPALLKERNDQQFQSLLKTLKKGNLEGVDDAIFLKIYDGLLGFSTAETSSAEPSETIDSHSRAYHDAQKYWDQHRIELSFIGHSMGAFVTTQTVRILSDVFDSQAIGTIDSGDKLPSPNIGRVFSLGRLVLVSPDIPVKTIVAGRTNFLRSSLRRFKEAYLFSNEGDLALRLASTAANYFSFPASTRTQGYRLGNVTINLEGKNDIYGIVNLNKLPVPKFDSLLKYIGIKVFNREERSLEPTIKNKTDQESIATDQKDPESIADLFTYFDCTEYRDLTDYDARQNQLVNVLIGDGQKSPLQFWNYVKLLVTYIQFSGNPAKGKDVHGGYFYGHFSKLIIYRLAFLGFQGLLDSLALESANQLYVDPATVQAWQQRLAQATDEQEKRKIALDYFSWLCQQKWIQVAASSERYYVDVLGEDFKQIRQGILTQDQPGRVGASIDIEL